MNTKSTLVVGFLLSCLSAFAQQSPAYFGKGLFNLVGQDSTWTMKIAMRTQTLAISEWEINDGDLANLESNFFIRRTRLKFDGFAFLPRLKYKIELGLSNRDISGANEFTSHSPRYILDAMVALL